MPAASSTASRAKASPVPERSSRSRSSTTSRAAVPLRRCRSPSVSACARKATSTSCAARRTSPSSAARPCASSTRKASLRSVPSSARCADGSRGARTRLLVTMARGLQETTNMKKFGEIPVQKEKDLGSRRVRNGQTPGLRPRRPRISSTLAAPGALVAACALLLGAIPGAGAEPVTAERLLTAAENAGEWLMDGRTYSAQRFSPLDLINEDNVQDLGLAWYHDLDTLRGVEATPLMIDGVLYNISAWNVTYAHDAKTGEPLWTFDHRTEA